MKLIILFILTCSVSPCFAQDLDLSNYIKFDTIIYFKDYVEFLKPTKSRDDYSFNVIEGLIYFCVLQKITDDFIVYKLNQNFVPIDSFLLNNKLKKPVNGTGILNFDVLKGRIAILTYNGWQIYDNHKYKPIKVISKDRFEEDKFYEKIKLLNDTVVYLTRAKKASRGIGIEDAINIVTYNYNKETVVSDIRVPTMLPQLGGYAPNNRIAFNSNCTFITDFSEYKVYQNLPSKNQVTPIINNLTVYTDSILSSQINELNTSIVIDEKMNKLIENNFFSKLLIIHDINFLNDTMIILRITLPNDFKDSINKSDEHHVWVKNALTNQFYFYKKFFTLKGSNIDTANTIVFSKSNYYKSLRTNNYIISNGKLYIYYWSAGIYPIGMNEKQFKEAETAYLFQFSPTPTILIYDLKDSFY